jgi:hypothetical protein
MAFRATPCEGIENKVTIVRKETYFPSPFPPFPRPDMIDSRGQSEMVEVEGKGVLQATSAIAELLTRCEICTV